MRGRKVLAGSLVAGLLIFGTSCGKEPGTVLERSSGQGPAVGGGEAGQGDLTEVGDAAGTIRGSFSEKDQDARRRRIALRVVHEKLFGDPDEADAATRSQILEALGVLDPVEVHDDEGKLTGYLTTRFVAVADYPAARAEAQRQLERYSLAP